MTEPTEPTELTEPTKPTEPTGPGRWPASGQRSAAVADAERVLGGWLPPDADQAHVRDRMVAFLREHPIDGADRDQRAGHLTASTLLLDHERRRVLLTLHPLIGAWVQLGGHVEPGEPTLVAAAHREAVEESGIDAPVVVDPVPLGLDWHAVTCRDSARRLGPSAHLDVTHLAIAAPGAQHQRSDESLDLAWFALDALPEGADSVVRAHLARAVVRARR